MNLLLGWMRTGVRDLRGDMRRFGVLIACLALGTSVIAAVGSVGDSLKLAVERDATVMMGGDLEAMRADRGATPDELAFLRTLGEVAYVVDSNARAAAGDESAFVDLLAVGEDYPLRGNVESPQLPIGQKPAVLLDRRDGVFGAIIDPVLIDRLGTDVGGRFRIGQTEFEVRGTLTSLPDGAVRGFKLGVTAVISAEALAGMTDLRPPLPGLLTRHRYKVVLADLEYEEAKAAIAAQFADEGWQTRSPRDAAGALVRYYDMFSRFLLIVGLSSLLVGGVGVSNGVSAYLSERQRSIATLRSLGATGRRIFVHFLTQVGILTAIGVGLGVAAGGLASLLILPVIGRALSVNLPAAVQITPLLTAASFGFLAGFAFSYLPLLRAQQVSPALLFRSVGAVAPSADWRQWLKVPVLLPLVAAAAGMFLLAVVTTSDLMLVTYYAAGATIAVVMLRVSGWLLQSALRRAPAVPGSGLRHALRNIHKPGSTAPVVIISIGLGLSVLLVIALLENNLRTQLLGVVSRDAPTFVATDLFDDELAELVQIAGEDANFLEVGSSPMLRAEITSINGRDPALLRDASDEAAFMLGGDIPVTWVRELPARTSVVEGAWWPADYMGEPLISLRTSMKEDLGLKIGDKVEFRMFAETVEATIANFRDYEWQNGINFMVTFSPGMLESYPSTYLGAIKAAEGHEKDVERVLARTFPFVSFIPIGDTLNQVADILGQLGMAAAVVGAIAVVNGLLVLAGTMAAGRKQREADAVVQKVLGARRGDVLKVFVLEYGLLGAFAALIASLVGIFSAWVITESTLEVGFVPDPLLIGVVIVGAVAITIAAGGATTWRVLSTRPARFLRTI